MLALEEWIDPRSQDKVRSRIALFNSITGEEVMDHGLSTVTQIEKYGPISWPNRDLDFEALKSSPKPQPSEEAK